MSTANHYPAYQQFELLLQQLQVALANPTSSIAALKTEIAQLQQFFQTHLVAELPIGDESNQVQGIQTEINKQLRLLETDVLFLQAARQPTTVQQRKQQMADRLNLLISYCAAVLGAEP